jgi:Skp family chaperone for outer membrane proteins
LAADCGGQRILLQWLDDRFDQFLAEEEPRMFRKSLWPALALAGLGAMLLTVRPADTAARAAAGPLGYVDVQLVVQQSPAGQEVKKQLEQLHAQLQNQLELKKDTLGLTEAERTELNTLLAKASPSDQEKARIALLRGKTAKLDEELRNLRQKPTPTDTEKARLQELTQLFSTAENKLRSDMETLQDQIDQKRDELMSGLQDKILKAVGEVAKDQGLAMVVDKQALLFGGDDITSQVAGKLKK